MPPVQVVYDQYKKKFHVISPEKLFLVERKLMINSSAAVVINQTIGPIHIHHSHSLISAVNNANKNQNVPKLCDNNIFIRIDVIVLLSIVFSCFAVRLALA